MEADKYPNDYSLLTLQMHELAHPALCVRRSDSIQQTAARMTAADSHTALVVDGRQLCGIVTDQNFRARVIAARHNPEESIASIMSAGPLTLPPHAAASEALLLMAQHNIRHIPVIDPHDQQIHGVVSATDLLRNLSHNAVYLIGDLHLAQDLNRLVSLSRHLPLAMHAMVKSRLTAYHITQTISLIGQAISQRLLQLAEQQLGPPPVAYAWLTMGSLARGEQTAHSDQDNGLLLADTYDASLHGHYFAELARFVCDGLHACGYRYCPGDIMATNPQWRQPLHVWQGYFSHWVNTPDPPALLHASIFFDLRCLAGDESLFQHLQDGILQQTQANHLFQSYLAANALAHRPPLNLFRGFILERQSTGSKGLDLKKRGVVPVIDLIRVHALATGIAAVNTCDRLTAILAQGHAISPEGAADLRDAFECISAARLQHQARQIQAGHAISNHVLPEAFSSLEQRHLKDAFEVVARLQAAMAQQYQAESFR